MASKSKNTPRPICHITFSSNGKNLKYETRAKKLWTLGGMSSPFSCLALDIFTPVTVFENHRKSRIQHCERSELRLLIEGTKVALKCQKWSILASF